jgi:asparagine synthase (glutamine-hydrolysing)
VIAPGFAKRIDYNAKCAKWPATPDGEEARLRQWRALTNGTASYECEVCNKAAARLSVEPRYPFYDRRLLEFCLAVPAEQKLNNGFVRSIMRRALKGTLPELVRWRGDKADARPAIAGALRRFGQGLINGVLQAGTLNGFVNLRLLEKNYIRFLAGDSTGNSDLNVWGAVTLARWLQSAPQN